MTLVGQGLCVTSGGRTSLVDCPGLWEEEMGKGELGGGRESVDVVPSLGISDSHTAWIPKAGGL